MTRSNPVARITSVHNERIQAAARLRDRRGRDAQDRIVIDGGRELRRALGAGVELLVLFVDRDACTGVDALAALDAATAAGVETVDVSPAVLARVAFGDRNDGVVGVARTPRRSLAGIELPPVPLVGVVEGVEKPGNLGAVLRSADGAGLDAVVVADGGTDLYNPNAIRASLGTIFGLQVCDAPAPDVLAWLRGRALQVVVARVDGSVPYTAIDYRVPTAIVLGSEALGLTDAWRGAGVIAARVPMLGVADSLNVSATAAVLFYEARRQRTAPGAPEPQARR